MLFGVCLLAFSTAMWGQLSVVPGTDKPEHPQHTHRHDRRVNFGIKGGFTSSLFLDERGADNGTFAGCQLHFLEFVVVLARTYAAPVGGARHILGCQVNDKLHVALDDVVGVTFRAHGNVAHGRVCTNGSRPCNGQYVIFFRGASAAHQYGGQRINHGSRFPVFFHQIISMSSLVCSFSQ